MHHRSCRLTSRASLLGLASVVGLLIPATGCDKTPPTGPQETVRSIVVSGNAALSQPGDTSQWNAVGFSAGVGRDVTAEAQWTSSDSRVLSVLHGVITARGYGKAAVSAALGFAASAPMPVRVLPANAFLVTGTVADAGFPISDAKVTFVSSAGTVSAMTDHDGTYRLPAAGVVTIRVEKAGYLAYQGELTADGDRQVDVGLSVDGARPELNGIYTMTFTASASCTTLPAYATRRTYTAKIDGTPTAFTVVLTGANFVGWWSEPGFTGRYVGPDVRFNISDDILDDYALIEDLGNGFLAYLGTAIGGVVGKNLVTTFNGTVRVYSGPTSLGTCTASDHRMEFVRK